MPSSSSTSNETTSNETMEDNDEHAELQQARKTKDYAENGRNALAKFLGWYKHHANDYRVFRKNGTSWDFKPDSWITMMDKESGKKKGNALFDYVFYARKQYHARREQGMGHFRDVRSALWNLVRDSDSKCYTDRGETHLTSFWTGLTKQNNKWVQENGIDDEAKVAVPFYVYEALAKAMLRAGKIKEWAYLVLQWNMMARKCNIADIHFNFIRWSGDMMTVLFCHSKTQHGKRKDVMKFHCSTNSARPWICPVTAVSLLLMLTSHNGENLFESTAAAAAYTKAFDTALNDPLVEEALRKAGVRKEDVASHSIRKSAATFASGGTTAPPSVFSILLRGGWSLGDVLSRYIKVAEDQDRFLAHILAGRDLFDKSFTMLPPHFVTLPHEDVLKSAFVGPWMETKFDDLKGVLLLLLASAVNAIDLLKSEQVMVVKDSNGVTTKVLETQPLIPATHPIFSNQCLHGQVHAQLKQMLAQGNARYMSSDSIMNVTGIPPWSLLSSEVKRLSKEQAEIVALLKELKEIGQNGGSPSAEAIANQLVPILNNHKKEIKNMIYSTQLNNSFGPLPLDQEGGESVEDLQNRRSAECFQSIMWQHSKKRKAPDEFSLLGQDSTIYRSFKLYYFGDTNLKISPLRHMTAAEASQRPTIPKEHTDYKKQLRALTKNYQRHKDAVQAISTHIQIKFPADWKIFCERPCIQMLNKIFTKGFKSLQEKLTNDLPPLAPGKKRRKKNWNALSASTLMNTLGSATKGYIKELTETMVPGTNTPFVKKNIKKGAPLVWNLTLPNKTLAIRLAHVHTPSTEAAPLSSVSPLPPGPAAQTLAIPTGDIMDM
jgi:hypothetical protein